jgi:hypothetical protein
MKLFTKEINNKLFKQYQEGNNLDNQMVVAKIFNPYGKGRWFLVNSDPQDPDYLWAIVQMGDVVEVGSVLRSELESIRVSPFRFPLERDLGFSMVNAGQLLRGLEQGKFYNNGGAVKYGSGGRTAGRWYKDNSGQELRYIGENSQGQMLFNDGEKIVVKDDSDFESDSREYKPFKWFGEGGEIKEEFLEDMAELHKKIAEITLVDGTKISGAEIRNEHHKYEDGGEIKLSYYKIRNENEEGVVYYSYVRQNIASPTPFNSEKITKEEYDSAKGGYMADGGGNEDLSKVDSVLWKNIEDNRYNVSALVIKYDEDSELRLLVIENGILLSNWINTKYFEKQPFSEGMYPRKKFNKQKIREEVINLLKENNLDSIKKEGLSSSSLKYLKKYAKGGEVGNFRFKKGDEVYAFQFASDKNRQLRKGIDPKYVVGNIKDRNLQKWAKVEIVEPWNDEKYWETYKAKLIDGHYDGFDGKIKKGEIFVVSQGQLSKSNKRPIAMNYLEEIIKSEKEDGYMAKGGHIESKIKERLSKSFDLPLQMAIYVPSTKDKNVTISKKEMDERVKEVEGFLAGLFGGFNSVKVDGGFQSSDKGVINEDAVRVVAFSNAEGFESKFEKLVAKVKVWCKEWSQESMGLEFENDLFYIEPDTKFEDGGHMASGGFTSSFAGTPDRRRVTREKGGDVDVYEVELEAESNPDYDKSSHEGSVNIKSHKVKAKSIDNAREIVMDFIMENDLGSGNWGGGNVYQNGKKIGHISYNGRYWDDTKMADGGETKKFFRDRTAKIKEPFNKGFEGLANATGHGALTKAGKMAMGGKVKFEDKVKAIKASLLKTKKVPKKVQKDYGKTYNAKEAEEAAKRIAGAMRKKEMK